MDVFPQNQARNDNPNLLRRLKQPMYDSAEELEEQILAYFDTEKGNMRTKKIITKSGQMDVPAPTTTGLALFLGFASRQSLWDYWQKKEFSYIIKKAKTLIEREYEEMLLTNPTAAIFALKQFGWSDHRNIQYSHTTASLRDVPDETLLQQVEDDTADRDDGFDEEAGETA